MKKSRRGFKAAVVAFGAAAILAGLGTVREAEAIEVSTGDLVLALYGNNTEFFMNLGQVSALTASPTPTMFAIDPAALTAVGGTNAVQWALFGHDVEGSGNMFAASSLQLSSWSPAQLANLGYDNFVNEAYGWAQLSAGDGLTQETLPASDPFSFTSVFGTDGSLAGSFPVAMAGVFGSTSYLLEMDPSEALTQIGMASLSNGTLTISGGVPAVPIPAAVVLFGTGLAGLVGVARRRLMLAA